jgi:restriction endonuclease, S subunit
MSEWPMVKLGEVCSISIGKTPARKEPRYWGEGLPWLSIKDMNQGSLILKTTESISQIALDELKITPYSVGTVLFSFKLSIGKVGITAIPLFTNEAIAAIEPKEQEALNKYYLMEVLREVGKTVEGNAAVMGGTLNKKSLAKLTIPLPPLGEQKRIAEILGRVAEAEQHVQDTLELLDEVAKSSFYTFCGIPDHFERRKKIGEIAIVATGNTPPRKDPSNYGSYIEWIKSDNLGSIFPTPASEFLSEEGLKRGRVAAPGSLLMTCIAGSIKSIGKCSVVNRKVAFNQQINSIKPVNNEDLYYLYLLFYVAPYLVQRRSTGGLKGIVKKSSLEMCEIPWPERKVRQMIGTFCQEWINCHLLVMRKLSLLQELQKSLTSRAFAGLL